MSERYFERLAAAFVRGSLDSLPAHLTEPALDELSAEEWDELLQLAQKRGLRIHRFKKTMELARVRKVLGALQGMQPASLLDLGSGRGAFLWPLLDTFPQLPVQCVDALDYRVADIETVRRGGIANLRAVQSDIVALPFEDGEFPCVTALEVLEHIPDTRTALAEMTRVAATFLILSVPSKADDNPEHIHLFDGEQLRSWLEELGWTRVKLEHVPGHLVCMASR